MQIADDIVGRTAPGIEENERWNAFCYAARLDTRSLLQGIVGLGPAKLARVLVALEFARRLNRDAAQVSIRNTKRSLQKPEWLRAVNRIPLDLRGSLREWIGIVPIIKTRMGDFCLIEKGSRNQVQTDPKSFFAPILALRARSFYLFHNHPSGRIEPSLQDQVLTQTVSDIAESLHIEFLGHWIVTSKQCSKIELEVRIDPSPDRHGNLENTPDR